MTWKLSGITTAAITAALLLGACSNKSAEQADTLKVISSNSTEPANPLIPAETNEVGGGKIISLVFSGLKYYDEHGIAHNDIAESITTSDNKNFLVKIRPDAAFYDGSPVHAKNFVNAWNYAVKNQQKLADFFTPILGYPDTAEAKSSFDSLAGLKIIDDHTFSIELTESSADFEQRLGYNAFFPVADAAFDNFSAYGKFPLSNGPYKLAKPEDWQHNQSIYLVKNDAYIGPRQAQNDGVRFVFYAQLTAAYADLLSGQLDVLDKIPEEQLVNYQADLEGRFINQPYAGSQNVAINVHVKHFKLDEEGRLRRKAISMAINRAEISKIIFADTRSPAVDFTSPTVAGFTSNLKGAEVLKFNPEEAKKLWAQAEKIAKFDGKFTIAYNSDAFHRSWVDAVSNQLKNVLNIQAEGQPYPDFKGLREDVTKRNIKLAYRQGWQADYPSALNFLAPNYSRAAAAGNNDSDYDNPEFDALLSKAAVATSATETNKIIAQAQEHLIQDLPVIPLWNENVVGGYSKDVTNVKFGWQSVPLYYSMGKK